MTEPNTTAQHASPLVTHQLVEAILFVAGEPLAVEQLARTLDVDVPVIEAALAHLNDEYRTRGIRLQRDADNVQLVTAPAAGSAVARFLGVQTTARLSNAALEVLAIIAYRQPITRAQIEAIRGVDSSGVLRVLLARDLVAEAGRLETVGRPILFATTHEFLRQFGIGSVQELPIIEALMSPANE